MKPPLAFLPGSARKPFFIILITWSLIVMAFSQFINAPLVTSAAPAGIVSFELARNPYSARSMVDSWDARARQSAAFGLGFDYLFMLSYAITIALACLLAAGRHPGRFSKLGAWLAWGVLLAGFFDALENIGLWVSLSGNFNFLWPAISFWCAVFKFTLILVGIAYGLVGWILPKRSTQ